MQTLLRHLINLPLQARLEIIEQAITAQVATPQNGRPAPLLENINRKLAQMERAYSKRNA